MSLPVGADIESLCSKCGDVWHVVVAKVGEKIVKVLCKQCGAQHRHRPLDGAKTVAPARARAPSAAATAKKKAAAQAAEPEPSVAADLSKPVRPYRPSEGYAAGERITHPTFGQGVVESSPGPGKVQVFFPGGRRILAQAKAASSLERPKPKMDDEPPPG